MTQNQGNAVELIRSSGAVLGIELGSTRIKASLVAPDTTPQPLPTFEQRVNDTLKDLRNEKTRMNMLAAEKMRDEASLWSVAKENRWTILLALAGIAFATWRLLRH